jgi:hypothetical protein
MGILNSLDPKSNQLWLGKKFAATARKRLVNWTHFIGTKSHDIPLMDWLDRWNGTRQGSRGAGRLLQFEPEGNMSNLVKVTAQLRKERDKAQKRVERLDHALAALGNLDGLRARDRSPKRIGRKRRTMSAAVRRKIAAAQRARWAKSKAQWKK